MAEHLYYYECPGCGHSKFSEVKGDFLCFKCDMFMNLSYELHPIDVETLEGLESVYARMGDMENLVRWFMTLSIPPKYSKIARQRCEDLHINLVETKGGET